MQTGVLGTSYSTGVVRVTLPISPPADTNGTLDGSISLVYSSNTNRYTPIIHTKLTRNNAVQPKVIKYYATLFNDGVEVARASRMYTPFSDGYSLASTVYGAVAFSDFELEENTIKSDWLLSGCVTSNSAFTSHVYTPVK